MGLYVCRAKNTRKAEERAAAKAKKDAEKQREADEREADKCDETTRRRSALQDTDAGVRWEAVYMLGLLSTRDLATHAGALIARLADADAHVRKAAAESAAELVGSLSPEVIAMHVTDLVSTIEHKDPRMRKAAAEALGKLSPEVLATNAALVAKLEDADADVAQTLGKLALKTRAAALVAKLRPPVLLLIRVGIMRTACMLLASSHQMCSRRTPPPSPTSSSRR